MDLEPKLQEVTEKVKVKDVSIYLHSDCNLSCTYCDRDLLDHKKIGHMSTKDVEDIVKYVNKIDYELVSFHGGEVLTRIRLLDAIISKLDNAKMIFIQTNGVLILKNRWFFEKYRKQLFISISYDFCYQEENRKQFDIVSTLQLLQDCGIGRQLQCVLPVERKDCFNMNLLSSIHSVFTQVPFESLTIIPLQYTRRHDGFEIFLYRMDVASMSYGLMQFMEYLYVMGVNCNLMGYSKDYNRHYFDFTKQIVLAPDGYLYPDYGFVENITVPSRLGTWRSNQIHVKNLLAEEQTSDKVCLVCSRRGKCGMQHVLEVNKRLYNIDPPKDRTKCIQFSTYMEVIMNHIDTLKSKKTLFSHFSMRK